MNYIPPIFAERVAKLQAFMAERASRPFEWGKNDCCLFACDWLRKLTGKDPATELGLRGSYSTKEAALAILEKRGGVERIAADYCTKSGWTQTPVPAAMPGDLICFRGDNGPALGVCCGPISFVVAPKGLGIVETAKSHLAWRIEEVRKEVEA